jgi:hypothetical protein
LYVILIDLAHYVLVSGAQYDIVHAGIKIAKIRLGYYNDNLVHVQNLTSSHLPELPLVIMSPTPGTIDKTGDNLRKVTKLTIYVLIFQDLPTSCEI